MHINQIQVSDLLSFGPEQSFDRFSRFNLFIGKNSSGKSNILRLIGQLPTEIHAIQGQATVKLLDEASAIQTYHFRMQSGSQNRNRMHLSSPPYRPLVGNLLIRYQLAPSPGDLPDNYEILFQDGEHISGDFTHLQRLVEYIKLPKSDAEFYHDFGRNLRAHRKHIAFLNFGLFFVFGKHIIFHQDGTFGEVENRKIGQTSIVGGNWSRSENYASLASGVFQCAKILLKFLLAHDKFIILIDEPEVFLEARTCRRLHQLLVWFCVCKCDDRQLSKEEISVKQGVGSFWDEWKKHWGPPNNLGEGENHEIIEENIPYPCPKQLFISSHSSVLINEFLNLGNAATIYEFNADFINHTHDPKAHLYSTFPFLKHQPPEIHQIETIFSTARLIHSKAATSILDNLGCKGSDLLQTNGIIWVEGPSDVLYIQKWIEMYFAEQNLPKLRRGSDYEFQMFGGTLLDSLCLVHDNLSAENEYKKLVEMFSFSRNAFIVIDSDAVKKDG
jgi:hypothetical protein